MKTFTNTLRLITVTLMLLTPPATHAGISCGDTIKTDTKLKNDLDCDCTKDPALTVKGPNGRLDLGKHTVSCNAGDEDDEPAIALVGDGALLQNGKVTYNKSDGNCVHAKGNNHKITEVFADRCYDGIRVNGNENKVKDCDATHSENGIVIKGKENLVHDNFVKHIIDMGIQVRGKQNKVTDNLVKNTDDGIFIWPDSDRTQVLGNTVKYSEDNGNGLGIAIISNNCKVKENKSLDNFCHGIYVKGTGNVLKRNKAKGNSISKKSCFDLVDRSNDCSDNLWEKNKFDKSARWIGGKYEKDPKCIE